MKNFLLISIGLVVLFCAVSNSYAAISFDSSSTSATLLGSTGTLSIVVGSGSNRAIIACITMNAGGTSTLLVGGSSATQIAHRVQGTKAADLYYFLNPSAGTVNVTATLNAAANKVIGLESLFGVDQSTPVEATTTFGVTGSTVASTTFTTIAANDWIIDCLGANQTSTSPGTGQTTTSMNNAVNPFIGMSYKQIPATGATTTQWTFGTSTTWAYSTAALRQAAPDGTSVSTTTGNDGAVSGNSITITGTNFGTVSAGNRGTCNGGVGTGCIKFIVGGNATIPDANVSAWTTSSITFSISSTLQSEGGASALQVWATNASDTTPLTLYIYPKITSIASVGTNAARVYNATDTDGLIMLSGDHLGTVTSTPTIFGITSTIHYSTGGSCTVAGYASTTQCLEVSASIATSTYSGTITFTRGSDSKQATTSLSILPRILAVNPGSTSTGNMVQIVGDHLCPSGTCPVSPNRATSTNKVVFGSTTSSDSDFLDKTGGGGTCNGSSAAWGHGEICVQVAAGTPSGSASTTVTGNGLASNIFPFTVISGSAPGTPGTPTYSGINSSTLTVNWASSTNSNYYKIERATSSQSYVQISTTSALSYGDSGLTANSTFYYRVRGNGGAAGDGPYSASSSVLTLPDVPGTPTYTNVGATSLTVNWTVPTGGAASYIIQRATSSQVYAQVATTTATSTGDSGLTVAVTYYYRVQGVNATGNGAFSASSSVTTADAAPGAPSQDSPLAASQNATTSAVFLMTATEADNDNLQYKVTIYSNAGCTTVIQTNDQSASQTGWSGQNASSSMEYTAGTQGIYTTQSALTANTTYYWRASAKDPEGANTWTNSATCNSFTTTYGNWTTDSGSWSISSNQLTVTPASSSTIQLHVTGQRPKRTTSQRRSPVLIPSFVEIIRSPSVRALSTTFAVIFPKQHSRRG